MRVEVPGTHTHTPKSLKDKWRIAQIADSVGAADDGNNTRGYTRDAPQDSRAACRAPREQTNHPSSREVKCNIKGGAGAGTDPPIKFT